MRLKLDTLFLIYWYMFGKLIWAAIEKVCFIYMHTQVCPIVHRGLGFL
jgi:hypothetical protein